MYPRKMQSLTSPSSGVRQRPSSTSLPSPPTMAVGSTMKRARAKKTASTLTATEKPAPRPFSSFSSAAGAAVCRGAVRSPPALSPSPLGAAAGEEGVSNPLPVPAGALPSPAPVGGAVSPSPPLPSSAGAGALGGSSSSRAPEISAERIRQV